MNNFYTNIRCWGNDILYLGYNNDGQRVKERIPFAPVLYVPDYSGNDCDHHSFMGTPLKPMETNSIKDAKQFINDYKGCAGFTVYGTDRFNSEYIAREYKNRLVPYDISKIITHFIDIEVYSPKGFPDPDIAEHEITAITIKIENTNKFHVWTISNKWSSKNFDSKNLEYITESFDIQHHSCESEYDLLKDFVLWFSMNHPDILSGWNSREFDVKYIINRIERILGKTYKSQLSPWGIIQTKTQSVKRFGQQTETKIFDIYGISELDYMDLYKKYTYTASESYSLDFISNKHLGVGKLEYEGTLNDLLFSDYQKYVEYNIIDVERISNLNKVLRYIELIVEVSYAGKVPTFADALGTVKYWEILIYNHLYGKDQFEQIEKTNSDKNEAYAGAWVKDPIPGMHEWVATFDVTSLYPSIIRQVNIGPETIIENRHKQVSQITFDGLLNKTCDTEFLRGGEHKYSMSANGQFFQTDRQSFLSELMEYFFNKRVEYKNILKQLIKKKETGNYSGDEALENEIAVYDTKQLAVKILINSAYGAVGNNHFKHFSIENAEAITLTGQLTIRTIANDLNTYMNNILQTKDIDYVIYGDTDSVFLSFDSIIKKLMPNEKDKVKITQFIDKLCVNKITPVIDKSIDNLFKYMNHYSKCIDMKRENIADRAVWTGKKRYAMNVYDKEGTHYYDEPYMKIMGIEVVKSSTPAICRSKLKDALRIILRENEDSLISHIEEFRTEFMKQSPDSIAFPRGISDIQKYQMPKGDYVKGTPIHCRAAILHNALIKRLTLEHKYDIIHDGDKIKFLYLRMPNPIKENVIGFVHELPSEFNLHNYIDYNTQFQKTFLDPLENIAEAINWKTEYVSDLSELFM